MICVCTPIIYIFFSLFFFYIYMCIYIRNKLYIYFYILHHILNTVSRPIKSSFYSYQQVKLKFNIFSNICQGFLVTKSQMKDKLLDNFFFFITLCCLTFLVLIFINLYKSIKHPRRISSHPTQISDPTEPFDPSRSLSGSLFSRFSLLRGLSSLSSSTTPHLRPPSSLTSLPLLRRGRFFITPKNFLLNFGGFFLLFLCCSIDNRKKRLSQLSRLFL